MPLAVTSFAPGSMDPKGRPWSSAWEPVGPRPGSARSAATRLALPVLGCVVGSGSGSRGLEFAEAQQVRPRGDGPDTVGGPGDAAFFSSSCQGAGGGSWP